MRSLPGFLLRRLLLTIRTLAGVLVLVFALMEIVPGDPAVVFLGENATEDAVRSLRSELGLDEPLLTRLSRYAGGVVRGDLGESIFQREPVLELIGSRLSATLELAAAAFIVALGAGMTLGIASALARGRALDVISSIVAQLGVSMPVFWLGILLMAWFSVGLRWFPAVGRGEPLVPALLSGDSQVVMSALRYLVLPAVTLGAHHAAVVSRLVRASMIEAMSEDYVRAARARGLPSANVVFGHALTNAVVPVVNVLGVRLGALLGGAVLTEAVFGWPGLGQLAVTAISQRDFPLVQGIVLTFALVFILLNIAVDAIHAGLDPRIRLEASSGA